MSTKIKTSNDVLDYIHDWEQWLDGDTITDSDWTAPEGITIDSSAYTTTAAVVWISGGVAGKTYEIVNQIQTLAGRTKEHTLRIHCQGT